ncbi:unnamed protein product, partial [Heterosigma akashiwo]
RRGRGKFQIYYTTMMAGAKSDMSEQEIQQKEHLAFFAVLAAFAKGVPATLSKNQIRILEKLLEALNISEKIKKSVRKMLAAGKVTKASRDEVYSRAAGRSKKRHRRPPPTLGTAGVVCRRWTAWTPRGRPGLLPAFWIAPLGRCWSTTTGGTRAGTSGCPRPRPGWPSRARTCPATLTSPSSSGSSSS